MNQDRITHLNKISRSLIKALRHKPEMCDLKLDKEGWTDVNSLLSAGKITHDEFIWIVDNNDKKRFEMSSNGQKVRASQGHSIAVDLESSWIKFIPVSPLYHGTNRSNVQLIFKEGLKPMSRTHVHLSKDIETAIKVGNRKVDRNNPLVILEIDAIRMINLKSHFYESSNGVILVKEVASHYIKIYKH